MQKPWLRYLVAFGAVLAALGLRWMLHPWLGDSARTILLYGAVAVAAWFGGFRPGVAAAVAGYIGANLLFIGSVGHLSLASSRDLAQLAGYAVSTLIIAALGGVMHGAVRRAEEKAAELRASDERFRQFMEHSPAMVFLKDEQGRYVFMNRAAEELVQLPPGGWEGKTDADILPDAEARQVVANDRKVLAQGHADSFSLTLPTRQGPRRFLSTKFPLRDPAGHRFVGSVTIDVTDQRRVEEELRLVTDTMSVGVVRCSRDFHYTWANRVFAAWAGRAPEAFSRLPVADVIGEDGVASIRPHIERVLAGERVEYERLAALPGLGRRWVHSVAEPTYGADGQPDGWVAVVSDVNERKHAEEQLREADRRKDEFLATLAHELRNPLAPISNAVAILDKKGPVEPEVAWARDLIGRQVRQMARLIDDLLDIARISSGKLLLRRGRVPLALVVEMAVETSRPHLDAARHRFSLALPAEPLEIDADATRLAQVLSNLLNNAAKYTEPGGSVALRAERRDAMIAITVSDTGIGFPPESAASLFEPFSQSPGASERAPGGLGLGLALARGIVSLHGGTIEAESPGPGGGSRFTVRLPLAAPRAAATPSNEASAGAPAAAGVRVLVADDNRDAADSLHRILALHGYEVEVAYDGPSAIAAAERFRPRSAVLDIGMPGANGYEVARALRTKFDKGIQLVALTGWGQDSDRRRAMEAGFDHHLTKPVDPAQLHRLLSEVAV